MDWQDRIAVVTGASSGVGEATAVRLAAEGMQVRLVARRLDRLARLQERIEARGGCATGLAADLSIESERCRVFDDLQAHGGVDVLINSAGFGWYGYFSQMPWDTASEMLRVNVAASAHLASLFLPEMLRRGRGHIINVGSIAGSIPSQGIAMYAATKAFLDAFTTSLWRELRGTPVKASIVRASAVRTEFGESALSRDGGGHVPTEHVGVSADHVAACIWALLQHPRRLIYVPRWTRVVPWAELSFGWFMDLLGPLLLQRHSHI
jgi:short-subunit dehydrogenase